MPTSAILVPGLRKTEKKKDDEQFRVSGQQKHFFEYLVLHKRILAVLKVATNADTTVENAYTVKSAWKYETQ